MARYAKGTSVSSEKSRAEIERTIIRYGADSFGYMWQGDQAMVSFRFEGKTVRFMLSMPDRASEEFTLTPSRRRERATEDAIREWEKACRQTWRALALIVKAKLEAVESGIMSFEEEFLPYLLMPDGTTVAEQVIPAIERAYETGKMPTALLLGMGETS